MYFADIRIDAHGACSAHNRVRLAKCEFVFQGEHMIIVTGGAGFIGSAMVWKLNTMGFDNILIVDNLGHEEKWKNLTGLRYSDYLHRDQLMVALDQSEKNPFEGLQAIVHMGACSSTTETDAEFLMSNNYRFSQLLAKFSLQNGVRFINASSGATYGDGSQGFNDDIQTMRVLKPLNMYGYSKQLFDLWAYRQGILQALVSLKFFNVYGPNEYHKGDMMSVVCKAHKQITDTGTLKLFRSYRDDYGNGEQKRDFIYVKDIVDVMAWFLENPHANGVFNVGTGKARTWNDLANAVFAAMGREPKIEYIDMPDHLREKYQYFTQAPVDKLRSAGYKAEFTPLEQGVRDYVVNYLNKDDPYMDTYGD